MYILQQILFYISTVVTGYVLIYDPVVALLTYPWAWLQGVMVISSYYHRFLSHRSWQCPKLLEYFLLLLGAGHGLLPAVGWVCIHRKHHRFADSKQDPHGPARSLLHNINFALNSFEIRYITRAVAENKLVMFQARYYWIIMLVYFIVWSAVFSPSSWFVVCCVAFLSSFATNMVGHWGKVIRNVPALGVPLVGETYHKNHHENPLNPRFGTIDPPWWFISLVQRLQKR